MAALLNPRHERFCLLRLAGKTIDAAYEDSGFRRNRSNAARLAARTEIEARIKDLSESATQKALEVASFDAKQMFAEIMKDIEEAKAAGDHRSAATLRMFVIRCFGYEDSPTLTHEHVRGAKLTNEAPAETHGETNNRSAPATRTDATDLAKALRQVHWRRKTV